MYSPPPYSYSYSCHDIPSLPSYLSLFSLSLSLSLVIVCLIRYIYRNKVFRACLCV
jgi:hypothetical protein